MLIEEQERLLSLEEMARNERVTPDTLCKEKKGDPWKKVKDHGILLKKIQRLRSERVKPDPVSDQPSEESPWKQPINSKPTNDLCIEAPLMMKGGKQPSELYMLILLIVLVLIWLIIKGPI